MSSNSVADFVEPKDVDPWGTSEDEEDEETARQHDIAIQTGNGKHRKRPRESVPPYMPLVEDTKPTDRELQLEMKLQEEKSRSDHSRNRCAMYCHLIAADMRLVTKYVNTLEQQQTRIEDLTKCIADKDAELDNVVLQCLELQKKIARSTRKRKKVAKFGFV